ncbi:MAG: hypothetical protein MR449_00630 [Spirochaetia bacterium]|nr:hypothetical protein [Spirochaetia bacterium]
MDFSVKPLLMEKNMKMTFDNWTDYDDWLIQNYSNFEIYRLNETDGKIEAEYCTKEEFEKIKNHIQED